MAPRNADLLTQARAPGSIGAPLAVVPTLSFLVEQNSAALRAKSRRWILDNKLIHSYWVEVCTVLKADETERSSGRQSHQTVGDGQDFGIETAQRFHFRPQPSGMVPIGWSARWSEGGNYGVSWAAYDKPAANQKPLSGMKFQPTSHVQLQMPVVCNGNDPASLKVATKESNVAVEMIFLSTDPFGFP